MRTWQLALCVLALSAWGCKTDPNQYLLERDLRLQEDRIYELESMLEEACGTREATLRENQALKKELSTGDRGAGPDYRAPASTAPSGSPPERRPKRDEPKLEPPTIELPDPTSTPPPEITPGATSAIISDGPVTQLVINKRLTGGMHRGQTDSSEGVMVAFEPRDAQGHTVKGPGAVSVVVLDPAAEGDAARVARWDFEAGEVPSHFRNSPFGRGLQFELPWSGEPPKHRDLKLYVRFTTPQGEKINADADIRVRTPDDPPVVDRKTKVRTDTASRPKRPYAPPERDDAYPATLGAPRDIPPISQVDAPQFSEAGEESYRERPARNEPDRDPQDREEPSRDRPYRDEPSGEGSDREPRAADARYRDTDPRDAQNEEDRGYDPRPDDSRPIADPYGADEAPRQPVRSERPARFERPARSERTARADRPTRGERPTRDERQTRADEPPRDELPTRDDRPVWKPYR